MTSKKGIKKQSEKFRKEFLSDKFPNPILSYKSTIWESIFADVPAPEQCYVCFSNLANGVFFECGHAGACYECGVKAMCESQKCYICRERITIVLKVDPNSLFGEYMLVQKATYIQGDDLAAAENRRPSSPDHVLESSHSEPVEAAENPYPLPHIQPSEERKSDNSSIMHFPQPPLTSKWFIISHPSLERWSITNRSRAISNNVNIIESDQVLMIPITPAS